MEDQGRKMIYVQTAGETVEKRYPYLGDSDGEWTEVISGVNLDERIVTKGTSMIRLASLGEMEMGHGHAAPRLELSQSGDSETLVVY